MIYKVEVKFNKDFITVDGDRMEIGVTSKPEKGRANIEVIKKVAKALKVPSLNVRIVTGLHSKKKIIEVV